VNLTRTIHRHSTFFFVLVLLAAIIAFWPGYLSQIFDEPAAVVHVHGALMSLWLGLLISQAYLIRTNRREIHRQVGKLSYLLAPIVFIFIAIIRHNAMVESGNPMAAENLRLLLPNAIGQPLTFAFTYGLAIYNKHEPATHARFMMCTPIPMAGPILNRVMVNYLDMEAAGAGQVTRSLVITSLVVLSMWDWFKHRRLNVFPVVLVFYLLLRAFYALAEGTDFQIHFAQWYVSLPLS